MNGQVRPETATIRIRWLVRALKARGLSAEPFGAAMAWVGDRAAEHPRAVLCRADRDGRLGFWWVRAGRDVPEYEWLCPADEIEAAAQAIARVLAARTEPVSG